MPNVLFVLTQIRKMCSHILFISTDCRVVPDHERKRVCPNCKKNVKNKIKHILKDTYLWNVLHVNNMQQHCVLMQYLKRNNMHQVRWLLVCSVNSGSHDIFVVGVISRAF